MCVRVSNIHARTQTHARSPLNRPQRISTRLELTRLWSCRPAAAATGEPGSAGAGGLLIIVLRCHQHQARRRDMIIFALQPLVRMSFMADARSALSLLIYVSFRLGVGVGLCLEEERDRERWGAKTATVRVCGQSSVSRQLFMTSFWVHRCGVAVIEITRLRHTHTHTHVIDIKLHGPRTTRDAMTRCGAYVTTTVAVLPPDCGLIVGAASARTHARP